MRRSYAPQLYAALVRHKMAKRARALIKTARKAKIDDSLVNEFKDILTSIDRAMSGKLGENFGSKQQALDYLTDRLSMSNPLIDDVKSAITDLYFSSASLPQPARFLSSIPGLSLGFGALGGTLGGMATGNDFSWSNAGIGALAGAGAGFGTRSLLRRFAPLFPDINRNSLMSQLKANQLTPVAERLYNFTQKNKTLNRRLDNLWSQLDSVREDVWSGNVENSDLLNKLEDEYRRLKSIVNSRRNLSGFESFYDDPSSVSEIEDIVRSYASAVDEFRQKLVNDKKRIARSQNIKVLAPYAAALLGSGGAGFAWSSRNS